MTLGEQFENILKPRLNLSDIEMGMARLIDTQMKLNVDQGQAFGTDKYDRNYERIDRDDENKIVSLSGYAKKRQKQGFQIEYTDLQKKRKRIKNTIIEAQDGAVISFVDGGDIFKYHHDGIEYRNGNKKMRSIFPKERQSIPADILTQTKKLLTAKLRG